jgi:hypothetical protein
MEYAVLHFIKQTGEVALFFWFAWPTDCEFSRKQLFCGASRRSGFLYIFMLMA